MPSWIQHHSLSLSNQKKHVALRRLYVGLRTMTVLVATSAVLLAFFAWLWPIPQS